MSLVEFFTIFLAKGSMERLALVVQIIQLTFSLLCDTISSNME